jgi:membrane-associated protease RseP (regulator of RpoE activity)
MESKMILLFVLSLLISIILHETAHLIAAKAVGCKVEVFSIGFGQPIWKKKIGETLYQFSPILLGGYCRVKGETGTNSDKDAFCNLRYFKKLIMITSGCLINIITGLITYYLGRYLHNYFLYLFGYLSIVLGIGNLLPIPALDGSYPILVWLEKIYGKEKGYELMTNINRIGFIILMALNLACIPWLIYLIIISK